MNAEVAAAGPAATVERPPLDDLMLAMDVVDTLRRRERLVARELDEQGREEDLKGRLQRIYAQQGIEVPDHVIAQAVTALREDRFTYRPVQTGLGRRLALVYVSRGRWGRWLGGALGGLALVLGVHHFAFVAPLQALPGRLSERHAEVVALAHGDAARAAVEAAYQSGTAALQVDDGKGAKAALERLDALAAQLNLEYTVQIVNRPGERSGVWRIPDINEQARNYYVIVEAVDAAGRRQRVPVQNEETGRTETVETWGLRVDEATFESVRRDKQDDGIIENDRFGFKPRGELEPRYTLPTSGGAITQW